MLTIFTDHAALAAIVSLIEKTLCPRITAFSRGEYTKLFLEATEIILPIIMTTPTLAMNVPQVCAYCNFLVKLTKSRLISGLTRSKYSCSPPTLTLAITIW